MVCRRGLVWLVFSGNMSWFDSSLSFAKTAFSQAQKSIDKVLDISETEQQQEGKGGGGEKSKTREHYTCIINVSVIMDIFAFFLFWRIYKLTASLFLSFSF